MRIQISFLLLLLGLTWAAEGDTDKAPSPPYSIPPRPCSASGLSGVCMFVWECVKLEGKHLGMCKEGFMFGSCCRHEDKDNSVEEGQPTMGTTSTPEPSTTEPPSTTRPSTPSWSSYYTQRPFSNHTQRPTWYTTTTTSGPKTGSTTATTPAPSSTTITHAATSTTTTPPTINLTFIDPSSPSSPPPLLESIDKSVGCGRPPLHPSSRIVGGAESPFASWPWLASVRRTSFFGFSSTHRCGGALLNEEWVATAGHCVDDLLTSQIRVRLGEWDFAAATEPYPHVERSVKRKVVHPAYNFFTYESDLALLQLDTPLPPSPHIVPLCLPANNDLLVGENATVAGWGRLSEGGQLPSRLQQVQVPIISNEECRRLFLRSGRVEHIPDIFLCAGYEGGGRDSCQGDSGGPLQVKGADGRWFLGGVISWGIGCAEANMPGVCTRVSRFREWIMEQVGGGE